MKVQIHAGAPVALFDVFKYEKPGGTQRLFRIKERPVVSSPEIPLTADEAQSISWLLTFRVTGTDVAAKERIFKLESDGQSPPKFYPV